MLDRIFTNFLVRKELKETTINYYNSILKSAKEMNDCKNLEDLTLEMYENYFMKSLEEGASDGTMANICAVYYNLRIFGLFENDSEIVYHCGRKSKNLYYLSVWQREMIFKSAKELHTECYLRLIEDTNVPANMIVNIKISDINNLKINFGGDIGEVNVYSIRTRKCIKELLEINKDNVYLFSNNRYSKEKPYSIMYYRNKFREIKSKLDLDITVNTLSQSKTMDLIVEGWGNDYLTKRRNIHKRTINKYREYLDNRIKSA